MREVHPAFDPITSTWFVGNKEARTIRELLPKLGKDVVAIGYQPIGQARLLILRESHDRSKLGRTLNQAVKADDPRFPHANLPPTTEQLRERRERKKASRQRCKIKRMFGVGLHEPLAQATAQDRERCTDIENEILDRWAKGESGPSIAAALGVTRPYVSANVVWLARLRGDPRAVVRSPNSIGKTRNKKATPTSGSHLARMYRQRMAELRALRERETEA